MGSSSQHGSLVTIKIRQWEPGRGGCVTAQSWEPVIPLPPLSPCCYSRGVEAAYQDEQGQGRAVPNNISELSLLIAHSPG